MSIRLMRAAWALTLPDSEKIVLLALADCADEAGRCWPGIATLTAKCSKSERTVQGCIKALVGKGHIARRERTGRGVVYIVHPHGAADAGERDAGQGAWDAAPRAAGKATRPASQAPIASTPAPQAPASPAPPPVAPCAPAQPAPAPAADTPPPAPAAGKPSGIHPLSPKTGGADAPPAAGGGDGLPDGLPDWLPAAPWAAFIGMRREMGCPLSRRALPIAIAELDQLRAAGHDPAAVLNQSTLRGWRGLFPLRDQGRGGAGSGGGSGGARARPHAPPIDPAEDAARMDLFRRHQAGEMNLDAWMRQRDALAAAAAAARAAQASQASPAAPTAQASPAAPATPTAQAAPADHPAPPMTAQERPA